MRLFFWICKKEINPAYSTAYQEKLYPQFVRTRPRKHYRLGSFADDMTAIAVDRPEVLPRASAIATLSG